MSWGETGEKITGVLERVKSSRDDWSASVFRLTEGADKGSTIDVKGVWNPVPGAKFTLTGQMTSHPKWGPSFVIHNAESVSSPVDLGLMFSIQRDGPKGWGEKTAAELVNAYGADELMERLDSGAALDAVKVSSTRLSALRSWWASDSDRIKARVGLYAFGLTPKQAQDAQTRWGAYKAQSVIEADPYQLMKLKGFGFSRADKIAAKVGIQADDPRRARANLLHQVEEATKRGSTLIVRAEAIRAAEKDGVPSQVAYGVFQGLVNSGDLVVHQFAPGSVQSWRWDRIERYLAAEILAAATPIDDKRSLPDGFFEGLALTLEQQAAVENSLKHRISVITGGPGVGKTYTTRQVIRGLQAAGLSVAAAAPTGKAAKRLEQMTGHPASTIHRMLGCQGPGVFEFGPGNPIPVSAVVIDETSMLDMQIAAALIGALRNDARIVFVGDPDQLPSVGPGLFLRDLVAFGVIPVTRLTQVFRQEDGSGIVTAAHQINHGQAPTISPDFRFWENDPTSGDFLESSEEVQRALLGIVKGYRAQGWADDQIQVLTPRRGTPIGVDTLNPLLQAVFNPSSPHLNEIKRKTEIFRVGDRILWRKNRSDLGLYNGDTGTILSIQKAGTDKSLTLNFPGLDDGQARRVTVSTGDLLDMTHAYAMTTHKSQGSEYPLVLMPVHGCVGPMLGSRQVLYTGVTRASSNFVGVGDVSQLSKWAANKRPTERKNAFPHHLTNGVDGPVVLPWRAMTPDRAEELMIETVERAPKVVAAIAPARIAHFTDEDPLPF